MVPEEAALGADPAKRFRKARRARTGLGQGWRRETAGTKGRVRKGTKARDVRLGAKLASKRGRKLRTGRNPQRSTNGRAQRSPGRDLPKHVRMGADRSADSASGRAAQRNTRRQKTGVRSGWCVRG